MKLTKKDLQISQRFKDAVPKQFGDLHERMRYLLALGHRDELWKEHNDVWQAIHDLASEISFYEPVRPPYGSRTQKLWNPLDVHETVNTDPASG